MCEEVFEIVKNMDRRNLELQLILQCAPAISGLKPSNLFIIPSEDEFRARNILSQSRFSYFRLAYNGKKVIYLIFDREKLNYYLNLPAVKNFLLELGYESTKLGFVLRRFTERYNEYIVSGDVFPHEMGLLLGYPLEDVTGFIDNKGQNFKLSGYWKVYGDPKEAKILFAKFDDTKDELIKGLFRGDSFLNLSEQWRYVS